ncbi:MAG: hypothetical protein JWM90_2238 [Thermoleophilia bacterium]|nr:hypothetical protein [Thermoleophilia bacterium]
MDELAVRITVDQRDRLYERHSTELKVFISSQMRGLVLDDERKRAVSTVSGLTGFRPWSWEQDATAGPYCSEGMCIGNARASDALVLILSEELTPVTRKEYEAAIRNQVQCFIFLKHGCSLTEGARNFVEAQQRSDTTTEVFKSLDDLEARITRALLVAAAKGWRITSILSADGAASGLSLPSHMLADNLTEIAVEVDGADVSIQHIIDEQRDRVTRGLHANVYDELWPLAEQLREWGYVAAAAALLHEIEELVGERIDARQRAWLLNCAGICLSSQGDQAQALKAYEEMRELGIQIEDSEVISTALQNLGVIAHIQGRMEDAGKLELEAVQIKLDDEDTLAAAQLILNSASTGLERWGPDQTEKFLDSMEWIIVGVCDAGLLASLEGIRGMCEVRRSSFDSARKRFSASLRYARRSGNASRELNAIHSLGLVDLDRGKPRPAAQWFRKGGDLAASMGDPQFRLKMQEGLAASYRAQGRHDDALDALTEALAWPLGGTVRAELAVELGAQLVDVDHERAANLLDEAIALSTETERADLLAEAHSQLAILEATTGKVDIAIERVRAVVAGIDSGAERARIWRNIARHTAKAAPDAAATMFHAQLDELATTRLSQAQRGWESATVAAVLLDAGAPEGALEFFDIAIDLNRRGDKQSRFSIANDRANTLMALCRYPEAREGYAQCLKVARQLERPDLQIQALANAGECERRAGHIVESVERLESARAMLDSDATDDTQAWVLDNLGLAYLSADRIDDADAVFTTALAYARSAKSPRREASALAGLASVARERGQYRRAVQRYRQSLKRDERINLHRVEALGSLLACYGNLADEDHTESIAQQLIDAAQSTGNEAAASERAAWAARQWLEHDLDTAADLYAIAILLAGVGADAAESDDEMLKAVMYAVAVTGHHTLDVIPQQHAAFGKRLARALKRQASDKAVDWSFILQLWDAFRTATAAR